MKNTQYDRSIVLSRRPVKMFTCVFLKRQILGRGKHDGSECWRRLLDKKREMKNENVNVGGRVV